MAQYGPEEAVRTPRKNNTALIVAIVVVVLLICCCCAALVTLFAMFGEDIMRELSQALPLLLMS